jgi:hypothetical protein
MWRCTKQAECPKGTTCVPLQQGGNVCAIDNTEMNGKAVGAMCSNMALCGVPLACDGTCRQQCNGPWDQTTCKAPQKCQSLHDLAANKTWAWVCK